MIRIVSKIKYQGKCDACGIGITCEKEDVTNVQVGMNELGNFVECPSCGEKIRVTEYMEQIQKRRVGQMKSNDTGNIAELIEMLRQDAVEKYKKEHGWISTADRLPNQREFI